MIEDILISVIVPVYNSAETLNRTVNSILDSGMTDFEILLVDDGSNDGSEQICDTLADEHAQIRCIHQINAGVSAARNHGIIEASGQYIWFFDADDSVMKGSLLPVEEILMSHAPDMLVFGMKFDYCHHGQIYRSASMLPPLEGLHDQAECSDMLFALFETNSLSALWSRIIKRRVIAQMDALLREDMFVYEDLEFVLRVMNRCRSIFFYREAVYQYRQSEDEGSAGRRLKRIAHIPELLSQISEPLADEADKDKILLALYHTLAREKINVSTKEEIEIICRDYRSWIDDHGLLSAIEQKDYAMLIYNAQVPRLISRRVYSKIRHSAANWLKQTVGDFRKW